jgi:hypothetical protein
MSKAKELNAKEVEWDKATETPCATDGRPVSIKWTKCQAWIRPIDQARQRIEFTDGQVELKEGERAEFYSAENERGKVIFDY